MSYIEPKRYRCAGCGERFTSDQGGVHPQHDPVCDGDCKYCPVECGPVVLEGDDATALEVVTRERDQALADARVLADELMRRGWDWSATLQIAIERHRTRGEA